MPQHAPQHASHEFSRAPSERHKAFVRSLFRRILEGSVVPVHSSDGKPAGIRRL